MTHLRKVELVGKPQSVGGENVQSDQTQDTQRKRGDRIGIVQTVAAQHNLDLRASTPHVARARALRVTRTHMNGIATMLRYLSANHDHMLASKLLMAGGLLSRIAR